MERVKVSLNIDKDVCKKVQEMADNEYRNFSQQVNKILKEYVDSLARD